MSVLDASAFAEALTSGAPVGEVARERIARETAWQAPTILHAEVVSAIRGLVLRGHLERPRADDARARLRASDIALYPFVPFERRVWELRDVVSTYDGWYVALAETLETSLVTTDARLARAVGPVCEIELLEGH